MPKRTIHGNYVPDNFNANGRSPRSLDLTDPEIREILQAPDLLQRVQAAFPHEPHLVNEFLTDLRQFERALNGDRSRPGEWNGRDDQPTMPMPFAPREEHRPDRQPGSDGYNLYRTAVENVTAGEMTQVLAAKMAENTPGEGGTLWDRMAPASERRSSDAPSLRESIQGAASALGD